MPRPTPLDSSPHGASGAANGPARARAAEPLPGAGGGVDAAAALLQRYLMRMLDEIDYGLVLLDGQRRVWHTNHLARVELTRGQLLGLRDGCLHTRDPARQSALDRAITRAGEGIRSMVNLREGDAVHPGTSMAFVPMGHPAECFPERLPVMGITCRQLLCEQISLHFFAQSYGLTRTEEAVLLALAQGMEVEDIVRERSLAVSTVRSHVKQLRIKTRSGSMRELLNKVSVLPPVVSSIRSF
jgi:DNA-binding CsgD family transcriptional regulator